MEFKISGRHLDITPAIHDYAKKKTDKLHRYSDQIQAITVVADTYDKNQFEIEIIIDVEHHNPFVAKGHHEDLYASIDTTVDKAYRLLSDHNSKLKDHKPH